MNYSWSTNLDSSIYKDSLSIRNKVFVEEQQVPQEMEVDEFEDLTTYVVGYLDAIPVVTARLLPTNQRTYKVQRVAVLKDYRDRQIGKKIMLEIERFAIEHNRTSLILGAQDQAIGFYFSLGYLINSDGYLDAGMPHHDMIKALV
ncbi:Predicted N-acyltransferase, GNAT family [Carnobacterium iners]|uniref:Predicted N-acyltransferase, GNAT family n=1 Tax=Carnobacterium iners TaxID=1073423 RepID=A0A1X7NQ67_9LACT|nr:GNAT family N-acetyltransferase [Carnobacterium iners]SEK29146.1 Predicted N-acyltransferase, GNAT family [Carnobacterium iners]SMH39796.1 Predicted N-acyltransferase, GNAT family [Carnobacterium iners]